MTVTGKGAGQTPFDSVVARRSRDRCSLALCASSPLVIVYFYALLLYASLVVALGANHAFTLRTTG